MTDHSSEHDSADDAPLVRFAGRDAVAVLSDGEEVDFNALPDPFTGESPAAAPGRLRTADDDERDAHARARLGRRLRALRENTEVNQSTAAERAGLSTARLAALEQGSAEPSLRQITAIVNALGAHVADLAAPDAPEISNPQLIRIAVKAGARRETVSRIADRLSLQQFRPALERGFRWASDALLAGEPRSAPLAVTPVFKAAPAGPPPDDDPTLVLARSVSRLSASATDREFASIPSDPRELRALLVGEAGDLTLAQLLNWSWEAGIVVQPLSGPGVFVAAVWYVDATPVIVLKESRAFGAYWLFDLAHELGHLALGHLEHAPIVEVGAPAQPDLNDAQEREANDYALRLLLPDPESMLADVRRRTANDAPRRFKFAVLDVAREAGIAAGVLGLVAAREMSDVPADKDRWGSAQNIAKDEDPNGRARVEAAFRDHIRFDRLDPLDAALLDAVSVSR